MELGIWQTLPIALGNWEAQLLSPSGDLGIGLV